MGCHDTERTSAKVRSMIAIALSAVATFVIGVNHASRAVASEPSDTLPTNQILVVLGASGEVDYGDQFRLWGKRWQQAFKDHSLLLIDGTVDEGIAESKPDKDQILDWISKVNAIESKGLRSTHWLVLVGHGTSDRTGAKFNLRGPDISDTEIATAISGSLHRWVIVNCSSSSAPFLSALSGTNRVVISATKSGAEQNFSRFGDYFSQAILDPTSDLDHDSSISVLEAFLAASNRVARFYADEKRLASEQSLLDDNGDRRGTPAAFFRGLRPVKAPADGLKLDGSLASRIIIRSVGDGQVWNQDKQEKSEQLQLEIEKLRSRKSEMGIDEYYEELERICLQLAEQLTDR